MNWKLKGNLGSACVDYKNLIGQQDFMFDKQKCNCLTCWSTYCLNHDETDNHLGGWITDTKFYRHFVWGICLEPMKYHQIRRLHVILLFPLCKNQICLKYRNTYMDKNCLHSLIPWTKNVNTTLWTKNLTYTNFLWRRNSLGQNK